MPCCRCRYSLPFHGSAQPSRRGYRQISFARVQNKRQDAGQAVSAEHIGRPDISASKRADVFALRPADQNIAERNGTQQVCQEWDQKFWSHVENRLS